MRKLLLVLLLLGSSASAIAADTYVRGHHRKDGTYVTQHYRSAPDGNSHNYSRKGDANPYAGDRRTVDPYRGSGPGNSNGSGFGRQPGVLGSSSVPVGSPLWSPAGIRKAGRKVNAGLPLEHQPTR